MFSLPTIVKKANLLGCLFFFFNIDSLIVLGLWINRLPDPFALPRHRQESAGEFGILKN